MIPIQFITKILDLVKCVWWVYTTQQIFLVKPKQHTRIRLLLQNERNRVKKPQPHFTQHSNTEMFSQLTLLYSILYRKEETLLLVMGLSG